VVALKGARRFRFVKYPRARPDELLVELPLMIAAQPALTVQGLEPPAALIDPVKRAQAAAHLPALAKLLHGAQGPLGLGRPMRRVVGLVQVLQRQHVVRGAIFGYVHPAREKTNRKHTIRRAAAVLRPFADDDRYRRRDPEAEVRGL
jgi:hypothetical protein